MSLLENLKPTEGSKHYQKRLGRGRGSGLGQTAGKGHKGQLARSGGKVRRRFEGGQTPLMRRLPKFGFSNAAFSNRMSILNLDDLDKLSATHKEINAEILKSLGLIKTKSFKVLGNGKLTGPISIKAFAFSEAAQKAILSVGGKIEVVK